MTIGDRVKARIWLVRLAQAEAKAKSPGELDSFGVRHTVTVLDDERQRLLAVARMATRDAYVIAGATTDRHQDKVYREGMNSFAYGPHEIPGWRHRT